MGIFDPNIDKLKASGNVARLVKALGHKKAEIREKAAEALEKTIGAKAVKPVYEAYKRGSVDRKTAAHAFIEIKSPEAQSILVEMMLAADSKDAEAEFPEERWRIANKIDPANIPDALVPDLLKRAHESFAQTLLYRKGPIAAKGLIRRFAVEKDGKAIDILGSIYEYYGKVIDIDVFDLGEEELALLADKLTHSDFHAISTVALSLTKAKVGNPAVKDYVDVFNKDWEALRARGKEAIGAITKAIAGGASSAELKGTSGELFELLYGSDASKAVPLFLALPPGEFMIQALPVVLAKESSADNKSKALGYAIDSLAGVVRDAKAKEQIKKPAAECLKKLFAESSLTDAMKQKIVACKGAVVYRNRTTDSRNHYDDCLTSGPPDTWHSDSYSHTDIGVDVKFEL